jgi:hypothetical protein
MIVALTVLNFDGKIDQPRPQGLPRGGARAEEDPGKINTAEKRLRMRQPYCNSIANLMRICFERFRRLKMAVKRSDFIVRLYSQISSAKINMSF